MSEVPEAFAFEPVDVPDAEPLEVVEDWDGLRYDERANDQQDDRPELGGMPTRAIATPAQAVDWMADKSRRGAGGVQGWCLRECRSAWKLLPRWPSAIDVWTNCPPNKRHNTLRDVPTGAPILYAIGKHGHITLASSVPDTCWGTDLPRRDRIGHHHVLLPAQAWGARPLGWCEVLNDVELPLSAPRPVSRWASGDVYLSKLRYGQRDSDSVRRLQYRLKLRGYAADGMPVTGNYLTQTRAAVTAWQVRAGERGDNADGELGPLQARRFFSSRYRLR